MAEKQEFKIRVRQYGTGEIVALAHHEIENEQVTIDDVVGNYTIKAEEEDDAEVTYREFDLVVSSTPPDRVLPTEVPVDVADGASEAAVTVPDPVPA